MGKLQAIEILIAVKFLALVLTLVFLGTSLRRQTSCNQPSRSAGKYAAGRVEFGIHFMTYFPSHPDFKPFTLKVFKTRVMGEAQL